MSYLSTICRTIAVILLGLALPLSAVAQNTGTVQGTVTDAQTGDPLPGVNVSLRGTTQGAATDIDGAYSISDIAPGEYVVRATFVGYQRFTESVQIEAGETETVDIALEPSAVELEGVAVTALGFQTQRDQLGSSQSQVSGAEVARSGELSVSKGLAAKASGLNITSAGGDPGSSARIVIRGNKSISGNNQPLIVLDGVPISNESYSSDRVGGNQVAGVQQQSRLNDINPADISSVEVLKGASAAALWGSRAQNGVIVIETKSGSYTSDINVSFRSSIGTTVLNQTQELQEVYGQGSDGVYVYNSASSWGDRIAQRPGGQDVQVTDSGQFFEDASDPSTDLYGGVGVGRQTGTRYYVIPSAGSEDAGGNPLSAEHGGKRSQETYDQGRDIFENGLILENNLSVSGGGEEGRYYASLGYARNKGIIPSNSNYQRTSLRVNADRQFTERFNLSASTNFVRSNSDRVQQGSNISGLLLGSYRTSPDFNNESDYLVDYYEFGLDGPVRERRQRAYRDQIGARNSPIYDNPVFIYNQISNGTLVNRITGQLEANYDVTDWFRLTARSGVDNYSDRRLVFFPVHSSEQPEGQTQDRQISEFRFNSDLIGRASRQLTDEIGLNATLGFSFTHREFDDLGGDLNTFSNPIRVRSLENAEATNVEGFTEQEVRRTAGLFSELDFDLYDQVFVKLTGRLDQASTFGPQADATFFYPSASVAWQFSDLLGTNELLSFGKLRGSFGLVGREPDPYGAFTYFTPHEAFDSYGPELAASGYGGGYEQNNVLGNPQLVPEETQEFEVGTDLRFVNDRVSFTANYYYNQSQNVIFDIERAPSTGFDAQTDNAAEITNTGIELELGVQWPSLGDFQWDTNVRWWTNDNEVTDLAGVETVLLQGFTGTSSNLVEGQPFGVLYGDTWREAPDGCSVSTPTQNCEPITPSEADRGFSVASDNRVLDDNGFPILATNPGVVGDPQADWRMGIGNTLRYKGLSLYTLFDFKIGGDVWNGTKGALYNFGRHADQTWTTTLDADQADDIVNFLGKTPSELVEDGNWPGYYANDDGSYTFRGYVEDFGAGPVIVDQVGFTTGPFGGFTGATDQFIEDGSFVKLREVTLSYDWRGNLIERSGLSSVEFSLSGANLITFTDYSGVDPETNLTGPTNGQGLDYFNNPNTRQYRFSIQLNY